MQEAFCKPKVLEHEKNLLLKIAYELKKNYKENFEPVRQSVYDRRQKEKEGGTLRVVSEMPLLFKISRI